MTVSTMMAGYSGELVYNESYIHPTMQMSRGRGKCVSKLVDHKRAKMMAIKGDTIKFGFSRTAKLIKQY